MRKTISIMLSLLLVLGTVSPVIGMVSNQGDENSMSSQTECLVLRDCGHGELMLVSEGTNREAEVILGKEIHNGNLAFVANETDDSDIYLIKKNQYAIRVDENTFISTERVDINVDDYNSNKETFAFYQLPQELIDDVERTIEKNKDNPDFCAALFLPVLSAESEGGIRAGSVTYPSPSYYTKYGVNFKDTFVKYWHESVAGQVIGSTTKAKAQAFVKFAISIAGAGGPYSHPVNAFSLGQSALSAFQALYGTVYYGSASDVIQTVLSYDRLVRTTRRENPVSSGDYSIGGCTTCKVWLDTQTTTQYYASNGNHYNESKYINHVVGSTHYSNAAHTAMSIFPNTTIDDPMTTQFLDGTAVF